MVPYGKMPLFHTEGDTLDCDNSPVPFSAIAGELFIEKRPICQS